MTIISIYFLGLAITAVLLLIDTKIKNNNVDNWSKASGFLWLVILWPLSLLALLHHVNNIIKDKLATMTKGTDNEKM